MHWFPFHAFSWCAYSISFRAVGKYFSEDDEKGQPIPSTLLILQFYSVHLPNKPIFNKLIPPMSIFIRYLLLQEDQNKTVQGPYQGD